MKKASKQETAFLALLAQHKGIVFKVAHSYSQDPDTRQDLVQEITLQVWKAFPQYDPQRTTSTWMYRIALNVAISFLRKETTRQKTKSDYLQEAALLTWEDPVIDERLSLLYRLIEELPAFDKAIIILHLEGLKNPEIAQITGISLSNVSTKLTRIRKQLSEKLTHFKHV